MRPTLQVIDGGSHLSAAEIDAAIAAIRFEAIMDRCAAEQFAERAEADPAMAAGLVTAAVAILAKSKHQLVSMIAACGQDEAAEGHDALKGVSSLPASPATVAAFLAHEADRGSRTATITRRGSAIRYAHRLADLEPPTNSEHVRATLRGIRRTVGAAPARKAPVLAEQARAMALSAPEGLKGTRDRALLLLGFAGAFRRSELVALDVADLEETEDGFKIIIRRSKTDQEGHGATIAIARGVTTCPVKAVKAWLLAAGITEGPLFRPVAKGGRLGAERLTDQSVCKVVKAYAERIGLKATDFGAHSLRAGFLTSAARRGASVFKMRDVSRHKSMDVLQAYVRDADLFRDHAGAGLL